MRRRLARLRPHPIRRIRSRPWVAAVLAALFVFLVALAGWTRGSVNVPNAPAVPGVSASPSAEPSGLLAGPSAGRGASPLPSGRHRVELRATSDTRILRISYRVKGARPGSAKQRDVGSPFRITTVGSGDGVIVEFGVQASPDAARISCSVRVDGVLRSSDTSKGGFAVAYCQG